MSCCCHPSAPWPNVTVPESQPEEQPPAYTIAMVGNPNSGKTTLFNSLTGANARVGNWAGVTVAAKTGVVTIEGQRANPGRPAGGLQPGRRRPCLPRRAGDTRFHPGRLRQRHRQCRRRRQS